MSITDLGDRSLQAASKCIQDAFQLAKVLGEKSRADKQKLGLPVDRQPIPNPIKTDEKPNIASLSPHLGWHNQTYTELYRQALAKQENIPPEFEKDKSELTQLPTPAIKIFGHLCDVIRREKLDSYGRIWLLLRYLDREKGEGRVQTKVARGALSHPESDLKCISKKQFQVLLRRGNHIFWSVSPDRKQIYLYSEARVAMRLGLTTIRGYAVEIPVSSLLKRIKHVRAIFYDAFHSGRGDGVGKPITRGSLKRRGCGTGLTQRKYEKLRGIQKRANFSIIGKYSKQAWQRAQAEESYDRAGGPAFVFVDRTGVLGENPSRSRRKKQHQGWHNIHIIRQIGNSYSGNLKTTKRSRVWSNRKLKHLCHSMPPITGTFGLVDQTVGDRIYFETKEWEQGLVEIDTASRALPIYRELDQRGNSSDYWGEGLPPSSNYF